MVPPFSQRRLDTKYNGLAELSVKCFLIEVYKASKRNADILLASIVNRLLHGTSLVLPKLKSLGDCRYKHFN